MYSAELTKRAYVATYTKFEDRWSFQGGSVENTFVHKPSDAPLRSRIDLVITHRQSDGIRPFRAAELADYTKLAMQAFDKTDTVFWQGENYLIPVRPMPALVSGSSNP